MNKRQKKWLETHYDIQVGGYNWDGEYVEGYKEPIWREEKCERYYENINHDLSSYRPFVECIVDRWLYLINFKNQKPKYRKLKRNK